MLVVCCVRYESGRMTTTLSFYQQNTPATVPVPSLVVTGPPDYEKPMVPQPVHDVVPVQELPPVPCSHCPSTLPSSLFSRHPRSFWYYTWIYCCFSSQKVWLPTLCTILAQSGLRLTVVCQAFVFLLVALTIYVPLSYSRTIILLITFLGANLRDKTLHPLCVS